MGFKQLVAWQRCSDLCVAVYETTAFFPSHERYGLVSQMRRAAVSAAANIAEGSAKRGSVEFRRYLDIANGSLSELECLAIIAHRVGMLSKDRFDSLEDRRRLAAGTTFLLYKSLRKNQ